MTSHIVTVVPSAGSGTRFSSSIKKTYTFIGCQPVVIHTLKQLQQCPLINEIIPVVAQEDMDDFYRLISQYSCEKIKNVVAGGAQRQDSINNALSTIEQTDIIVIHDGVRPFINQHFIELLIQSCTDVDGVIPGLPITDTIKKVDESGLIHSTIDRRKLIAVQTPQVFKFPLFKQAYKEAYRQGFYGTDDASLIERVGGKVKYIQGLPFNIKITVPEDKALGEFILQRMSEL